MVESWVRLDQIATGSPPVQPAVNSEANHSVQALGPADQKAPERNTDKADPGETGKLVDEKLLEEAQSWLDSLNIQLSFSVHYKTRDTVVQVIDSKTGDVIRQIPSDQLLHLKERMIELRGMLFDQKG
jgi:flagellar protein FlaG